MKTAPGAVIAYLNANNVAFRADLYTFTLSDGTILRWTTGDVNITVSGNTWLANGAVTSRGNLRNTSTLEIDAIDVMLGGTIVQSGKTITVQAIQGFFDDARVQVDHLVGSSLSNAIANGPVLSWFEGRVSMMVPQPQQVRVSVVSELETLGILLPRFSMGPMCQFAVYDTNCGISKATFTIAGTTSATGTTTTAPSTTAGIIAKASGYFELGVLVFTSGALNGVRAAVRTSVLAAGTTTFTFTLPLPSAPVAGVSFTVYPGCKRTKLECSAPGSGGKFSNLVNFRGFPHIPVPEAKN